MKGLRGSSVRFQLIVNLLLISLLALTIAFTLLYFISPLFAEPHFPSVATLVAVSGLTLVIILFVAFWMEKRFSVPLDQLFEALKSLSSDGDYTQRLKPRQHTGFGKLYEGINDLLEAIQRRDASISAYSSDMSRLVEARTSQLSREHVELEKKIQDFARAKSSAEVSNRAKSRFLADATHEIRAPMNGMLGMTELLLGTQLDEKQFHYANTIRNSGGTLLNIVNDLLDFSKIEAGRLDLETVDFDLQTLVAETCELFKKPAHRKGLSLEYVLQEDVPCGMQGDPTRLRQVLTNLLGNAIKFTESGEIRLTVSRLEHGVQAIPLCFQVTDTGIGIPEEKQSEIFSAFTQADGSTSRYFGGTGLGLSISQQLSQLMGGYITVESEPGRGSTFRFAAGFAAPSENWESELKSAGQTDATAASVTPPVFAARVLLAEDNPVNQEVTEAMLQQLGCQVDIVADGEQAIEAVRRISYDLLLMDIHMPGQNGIEATQAIRRAESDSDKRLVIVAITARTSAQDLDQYLQQGLDDFLAKPFELTDLASMLGRWLTPVSGEPPEEVDELQEVMDESSSKDALVPQKMEKLRTHYNGKRQGRFSQLIKVYLESSHRLLDNLLDGVETLDAGAISQAAHSLSAASGNLAATELASLCKTLELEGRAGQLANAPERLAAIEAEYGRVGDALQGLVRKELGAAESGEAGSENLGGPRVLIVDDEITARQIAKDVLEDSGFEVLEATEGYEALELFEQEQPDLVLLDVEMPLLDGFETCRRMNRRMESKDIPIVMVTGRGDIEAVERAYTMGATDFVTKPVKWPILLQRINYILASAEILEKLRQNERSLAHALEELRGKRDEALSAVKARGEFLANMSHEIRTPMNGVMGMLALLEDADLEGKERDYLDTARRSADSLLHIINDILDFSKIEAEKLTLECVDFDLGRLVEETASLFVESANSKNLELNCYIANSISGIFSGDPTRIRQVLSNLVSNAVKFTNRGGVFLKVELQEEHGGKQWMRFTVEDTGIGVQEDDQAHLFEPFTQGDGSVTRKYGGTGLGLSISKELVRMMGGELGMTSRVGRGSSFFFHLPLTHVSKAEPFRIVSESDLLEHWVMIAGGSATSRFVLETYLETDPFLKLSTCASYAQAMQILHENAVRGRQKYHLLMLDCDAIESGGREYVEGLKNDPATNGIKIVSLVQGGRSVGDYDMGEIDGVLAKPVRKTQLFEMLGNLFSNRDKVMLQQGREGKREQQILPRFQGLVLVVDDEPMNLMVAVGILEKLGISPDEAKNGQQAIEKSRMVEYDLILMDCQMPGMSGYEVTGMIRNREALSGGNRTPIIAMTANAMEGAKDEAIQHGMDDYISKPFQPGELASLLSNWLLPALEDAVDSPDQAGTDEVLIEGAEPEQRPVVWDRVAALKTIDGDEKLLGQMIEMFVERVPVTLGQIISAMDEDDAAVMAGSAHALKGLVSHFSAYRARDLAAELEKRAKRGELAGMDELVGSLRLEVETLVTNLDEAR
ncbi:MAG: response regulator [gamma proteobacterium endosymbiont of Lamellibrachia anaximandri]|nr:response regulator [gamma proteobacterium endosymbiont of Lamellibrachia anaximandri]MBL3533132.1 response regulator [gamma proteobacterium endosymbiont of Lamellibrachia anaximandri]